MNASSRDNAMAARRSGRRIIAGKTRTACEVSPLERRLMLHAGCELNECAGIQGLLVSGLTLDRHDADLRGAAAGTPDANAVGADVPGAIPQLSSNPSATAKLYLDFDGEAAQTWGSYSVTATPAYSTDADTTTFSDSELASIQQIWARVAEKYAPFSIDVTTIDPGTLSNKVAAKVVIGGNGSWTGGTYGGIAYVGGFYNASSNTAWVFEDNLGNGAPSYTSEAVAHEAGHTFGLQHQSLYDANGVKTQEYYQGDGQRAPILGNSYYAARGLWWYGTSTSATTWQDDMAVLSNSLNGFGYRADDFGSVLSSATSLMNGSSSFSLSGIIERTSDKDFFAFTTDAGTVSLSGSVAAYGATLDLKLEVFNASGQLIATADSASLGESLSVSLAAGSYYVAVASHGGYGDVGQYTLSGAIVQPVDYVPAPANLAAGVVSATQVSLFWSDQSSNETGFVIQRSTDGGVTWMNLVTTAANTTGFTDASVQGGVSYLYRVCAAGSSGDSAFSNTASATTIPNAPTGLVATGISASQINLSWVDVSGETGYRIERSLDGLTWSLLGTTGADVVSFQNAGLAAGTSYYYRVFAVGLAGNSPASNSAMATTQTLVQPAAPSSVTATPMGRKKVLVAWQDNSSNESGFKIQRSSDGQTWQQIGTATANATSYTDSGVKSGACYYRVIAWNAAGDSVASEPAYTSTGTIAKSTGVFSAQPIGDKMEVESMVAKLLKRDSRLLM